MPTLQEMQTEQENINKLLKALERFDGDSEAQEKAKAELRENINAFKNKYIQLLPENQGNEFNAELDSAIQKVLEMSFVSRTKQELSPEPSAILHYEGDPLGGLAQIVSDVCMALQGALEAEATFEKQGMLSLSAHVELVPEEAPQDVAMQKTEVLKIVRTLGRRIIERVEQAQTALNRTLSKKENATEEVVGRAAIGAGTGIIVEKSVTLALSQKQALQSKKEIENLCATYLFFVEQLLSKHNVFVESFNALWPHIWPELESVPTEDEDLSQAGERNRFKFVRLLQRIELELKRSAQHIEETDVGMIIPQEHKALLSSEKAELTKVLEENENFTVTALCLKEDEPHILKQPDFFGTPEEEVVAYVHFMEADWIPESAEDIAAEIAKKKEKATKAMDAGLYSDYEQWRLSPQLDEKLAKQLKVELTAVQENFHAVEGQKPVATNVYPTGGGDSGCAVLLHTLRPSAEGPATIARETMEAYLRSIVVFDERVRRLPAEQANRNKVLVLPLLRSMEDVLNNDRKNLKLLMNVLRFLRQEKRIFSKFEIVLALPATGFFYEVGQDGMPEEKSIDMRKTWDELEQDLDQSLLYPMEGDWVSEEILRTFAQGVLNANPRFGVMSLEDFKKAAGPSRSSVEGEREELFELWKDPKHSSNLERVIAFFEHYVPSSFFQRMARSHAKPVSDFVKKLKGREPIEDAQLKQELRALLDAEITRLGVSGINPVGSFMITMVCALNWLESPPPMPQPVVPTSVANSRQASKKETDTLVAHNTNVVDERVLVSTSPSAIRVATTVTHISHVSNGPGLFSPSPSSTVEQLLGGKHGGVGNLAAALREERDSLEADPTLSHYVPRQRSGFEG